MPITDLSRGKKTALMILTDIALVILSLWFAFVLRLGIWFWPSQNQMWLFIAAPVLSIPIFIKLGLYREVVRYIGNKGMLAIVYATGLLSLSWLLVTTAVLPIYLGTEARLSPHFFTEVMFPRSVPVLFWMVLLLSIGSSRQAARWLLSESSTPSQSNKNVLIYGAGRVGLELATSLSYNKGIKTLGFIDDDPNLRGHFIQNLKVLGDRSIISQIRSKTSPLEILLATPKMSPEQRKELLKYLEDKKVSVKTIPSLNEIASGKATVSDVQDVNIEELLERKEVPPNQKLLVKCVYRKKILVTGAGGSIGSEICRQILKLNPYSIVLFEHSEHNLYQINAELSIRCLTSDMKVEIIPVLGSITNEQRVKEVIKKFNIDTIYHAAAYKHVNLIEGNIEEGVRNNIFGTYNVAQAAYDLNVENFILISSDKAVRPTSIMGATKRIAEIIIQSISQKTEPERRNQKNRRRFTVVRFGNVLASSGSVIPLFQKQIASGGPITITHPKATRYFMTTAEASQLVIQAGSLGKNGNIFVLNMGKPVSILSLAKKMIYLSGHVLRARETEVNDSSIEIQFTGLQKGEKIHEELFTGENTINTEHPMIMEAQESFLEWPEVETMLSELEMNRNCSDDEIRQTLLRNASKKRRFKTNLIQMRKTE